MWKVSDKYIEPNLEGPAADTAAEPADGDDGDNAADAIVGAATAAAGTKDRRALGDQGRERKGLSEQNGMIKGWRDYRPPRLQWQCWDGQKVSL